MKYDQGFMVCALCEGERDRYIKLPKTKKKVCKACVEKKIQEKKLRV